MTAVGDHTAWLSWDPVDYQDPGGYRVYASPAGEESWSMLGFASDKGITSFPVTGLTSGTSYDVGVASFTRAHDQNDNFVVSERSLPVMTTTSNIGCDQPTILVGRDDSTTVTLSLDDTYGSYLWSTGETTSTIEVPTTPQHWYWVTVTLARLLRGDRKRARKAPPSPRRT